MRPVPTLFWLGSTLGIEEKVLLFASQGKQDDDNLKQKALDSRNLGCIPTAAQGLYKQDAGGHAAREKVHSRHFVGQRGTLGCGYLKIIRYAATVTCFRQRE